MYLVEVETLVLVQNMGDTLFFINVLQDDIHIISDVGGVDHYFIKFGHLKQERLQPESILRVHFYLSFLEGHCETEVILL